MKTYHAPYSIDGSPRVAAALRLASVAVAACTFAAAGATAGPGNWQASSELWAASQRPDVARIQLPTVVVTGQRTNDVGSVSCAKGA